MRRHSFLVTLSAAACLLTTTLLAQDDAKPQAKKGMSGPRTVARNLDNPSGIVVHSGTGHVFVAEHRGVVRLFKQEGKKGYSRKMQVVRYPSDVYGKGPKYDIGPLGLAFLGEEHLVVGDGSRPDGEELIRVYEISAEAPEKPTPEKNAAHTLGPITAGETSAKGEGNYYGVVATDDAIFPTANGDDTKGWIVRAKLNNGKPGKLEGFIATKQAVSVDAPCALTTNSDGDLVVGQMGEISVPADSLVCVYDAESGELKKSYETGLNDIVGLAFNPDGKLYAVDFSWIDASKGALYELTMEGDKCSSRKIVDLDKPTSLAFDADGSLLVTVFGTAEEGSDKKSGEVVRINKRLLK